MAKGTTSRRNLVVILAGLIAISAAWQVYLVRPQAIEFDPIEGLSDWRQVAFSGVSVGVGSASGAVLVGIDAEDAPEQLTEAELCRVLYPATSDKPPVTVFSDANCPNCRSLEAKLAARSDRIFLRILHLPLLGPNSESAARAMLAAELQGMGAEFRNEFLRQGSAPHLLGRIATASGVDATQLMREMNGPEVAAHLLTSRRAAETLGVWGTPALTIGKTLVMGDMSGPTLDRLIGTVGAEARGC